MLNQQHVGLKIVFTRTPRILRRPVPRPLLKIAYIQHMA
jgi:hypothetical protein